MKISSTQIKKIENDLSEPFEISTGNLRKILEQIYSVLDEDKAKKITSRSILKQAIAEINKPFKNKYDETDNPKDLAKCWGIFPLTGTSQKGKYKEELMTYREAKLLGNKKVNLTVFTTRRKNMIHNMTREMNRAFGLIEYFE